MMTREQIKAKYDLKAEFERRGVKFTSHRGDNWLCRCPFHEDKNPSCQVDVRKQVFHCFGCSANGSIIDAVMLFDGISVKDAMRKLDDTPRTTISARPTNGKVVSTLPAVRTSTDPQNKGVLEQGMPSGKIIEVYPYTDENGKLLYEAVRLEPKDFRQRHYDAKNAVVWNMEGVKRVLYRLPKVMEAQEVVCTEGEKDVHTLESLGYAATTSVGGSKSWMESYANYLSGKDLILCGDNDEAGKKYMDDVFASVKDTAKTVRIVKLPAGIKDISDFAATFKTPEEAKQGVIDLFSKSTKLYKGVELPVFSLFEIEREYVEHIRRIETVSLKMSNWIPSLYDVRNIVPGEIITFLADTGTGKTAILQNLAIHAKPLEVLLFELELPNTLTFERFVCHASGLTPRELSSEYQQHETWKPGLDEHLAHIHVCPKPKMTVEEMERIINLSELKIGRRPQVVLVDYIQLLGGKGSDKYERISAIAEDLKVLAKQTRTIVVIASQVSRKKFEDDLEIFLHDGKDSGSIENSSGLVIGMWRDSSDQRKMFMRILKNTKGTTGKLITLNFNGELMRITEQAAPKSYDSDC